jgi:hypothetical protein
VGEHTLTVQHTEAPLARTPSSATAAILYASMAAFFHVWWAWILSGGFLVVLGAYLIAPNFKVRKKLSYAEKVAMSDAPVAGDMNLPHVSPRRAFALPS